MKAYRYGLNYRPIMTGGVPRDFLHVPGTCRTTPDFDAPTRFGYVFYEKQLAAEDVKAYELSEEGIVVLTPTMEGNGKVYEWKVETVLKQPDWHDYVNDSQFNCPFCESSNLEAQEMDGNENSLHQVIVCKECFSEWTDTYERDGVFTDDNTWIKREPTDAKVTLKYDDDILNDMDSRKAFTQIMNEYASQVLTDMVSDKEMEAEL